MLVPRSVLQKRAAGLTPEERAQKAQKTAAAEATRKAQQPRLKAEDADFAEQLICAVELILCDPAYQNAEEIYWLYGNKKTPENEKGPYVHIGHLKEHYLVTSLKPSRHQQKLPISFFWFFRDALIEHVATRSHPFLELSEDHQYVRRSIPSVSDKTRLDKSELDARTVYVEPHFSTMCREPAKVVWYLKKLKNGELQEDVLPVQKVDGVKDKNGLQEDLLPVQKVNAEKDSCAFLALSAAVKDVGHEGRLTEGWPKNWIVLTKAEYTRRVEEYKKLRDGDRARQAEAREKERAEAKAETTIKTTAIVASGPSDRAELEAKETPQRASGMQKAVEDEKDLSPSPEPEQLSKRQVQRRRRKANQKAKKRKIAETDESLPSAKRT